MTDTRKRKADKIAAKVVEARAVLASPEQLLATVDGCINQLGHLADHLPDLDFEGWDKFQRLDEDLLQVATDLAEMVESNYQKAGS